MILYSTTSLYFLVNSFFIDFRFYRCLFIDSIGFSLQLILLSVNKNSLASSFQIWSPFLSLPKLIFCLIIIAKILSTLLINSVLFFISGENIQCFTIMFLPKVFFIIFWEIFFYSNSWIVWLAINVNFCQIFFLSLLGPNHFYFFFSF